MANAARLEVDIPFDGQTYSVKPTFDLVGQIESSTGKSCAALADRFFSPLPSEYATLSSTAQVLFLCLRGQIKGLTMEKVGAVLMDDGCGEVWGPLGSLLGRAVKGHKEHIRMAEEASRRAEQAEGEERPLATDGSTLNTG